MKVKLRTIYAGPQGNGQPGDTLDLPVEDADALVKGRYAEYVVTAPPVSEPEPDPPPVVVDVPEPDPPRRGRGRPPGRKSGRG